MQTHADVDVGRERVTRLTRLTEKVLGRKDERLRWRQSLCVYALLNEQRQSYACLLFWLYFSSL